MTDEPTLSPLMLEAVHADAQKMVDGLRQGTTAELYDMIAHHFGWPEGAQSGKGIRPLICLLTCAAAGGDWEAAVPAATGIELIHNFSLIHDDIEDGSEMRRHRPTVWKLWGTPQAINAGDALFAIARLSGYRLLQSGHESGTVLRVQKLLDETCLDLTKGQYLDLGFQFDIPDVLPRYLEMIQNKTAALVAASAAAGAVCAGAEEGEVNNYHSFGLHLGLAFQILDDILGTWGAEGLTGKPVGSDVETRKPSYPAMFALDSAEEFSALWLDPESNGEEIVDALNTLGARDAAQSAAQEQTQLAFRSLDAENPLDPANSELRSLADRLLVRES